MPKRYTIHEEGKFVTSEVFADADSVGIQRFLSGYTSPQYVVEVLEAGDFIDIDDATTQSSSPQTTKTDEHIVAIWAEENSTLANGAYEWAFGNGANSPDDGGIRIYVPTGWQCELKAMSLQIGGGTASVLARINEVDESSTTVTATGTGGGSVEEFTTPIELFNNAKLNFKTVTASGTSSPNVVTAWLRYYR